MLQYMGRAILVAVIASQAAGVAGYPLDGTEHSGIQRLIGYQNSQAGKGRKLPPGALLNLDEVQLQLSGSDADLLPGTEDKALAAGLQEMLGKRDPSYAIVVVDITDPEHLAWAGVNPDLAAYPGSVGKILCMVALFDGLARAFPETDKRLAVLRDTMVTAGEWVVSDSHSVPHFDPEAGRNRYATIGVKDRFRLSEWVDHMVSPSANAAGAVVWREAILVRHFGASYPPSAEQEKEFWAATKPADRQKLALQVIEEPLQAAGIDTDDLRQGSMWTRAGKARVPGVSSYGTPRQLARLLLRLEQGRLVDAWSSLEMKRFLYMTKKRYRYVYAPELADAAVYFKSGSLYRCAAEPGFRCGKYMGNAENRMNSVVIVESPARGKEQRRYIVAMMSNVLRKNSAWDHSRIGAAVDELVRTRKPAALKEAGSADTVQDAGKDR